MNATPTQELTGAKSARKSKGFWTSDAAIYLLLVLLTWGTWQFSRFDLFKAGDDTGYWIGVAGGMMMVILFGYPLRKHFRFAQNWGRMKWWFWLHMSLGIGGPVLILVHSTFRVGSLNAAVALYSMIIVAISGVIGRFLLSRVSRGLYGEKTDLDTLLEKAGLDKEDARSRLAFAPEIETRLKEFERRELNAKAGWTSHVRQVFWLPILQQLVYRKCASELDTLLPKMAAKQNWSREDLVRRRKKSRQLVRQYLNSVVRVSQYSAYSTLFSLWHVAHIPFVYILIITALVHVYAVHVY
jgi:hypothetical protein